LFVSTALTPRRLPWLVGALVAVGFFQAGVGVWQFGLRGEGPEHFAILGGDFYRAYGTFEQPNPYAGFLGMMLALAVGAIVGVLGDRLKKRQGDRGRQGERKGLLVSLSPYLRALLTPSVLVLTGAAIAMGVALLASWSRGAWMGFGAAAAVMAFALPRKARWGLLVVAVLVVAGAGLYAAGLMPASVEARLTDFAEYVQFEDVRGVGINDANYAVIERQAHWQAALEMWHYNFWTGVGFGCYEPAYRTFALINWPIALGHAHNYYLNIAAETGLIGLVTYLVLWGVVFWQTWRATRRANGLLRGLAIGLLGTWTHLSVHHLFDNLYVNNVHLYVGVLFGLLAYVVRRVNESTNR
jgi:putative inorganic carbon (HCO3(-)) transporter